MRLRRRGRAAPTLLTYTAGNGGALFVGLLVAYLAVGRGVATSIKVHDFMEYYSACRLMLEGHAGQIYTFPVLAHMQAVLARPYPTDHSVLPFLYPPYFALVFAPLAALPYGLSFLAWLAINCSLLAASLYVLERYAGLGPRGAIYWRAASICSLPVLLVLGLGQVSIVLLAILTFAFAAARSGREVPLGIALALALLKPTYLIPFVLLLAARRMWTALTAFAATATALILLPLPVFGAGIVGSYARTLAQVTRWQGQTGTVLVHGVVVAPATYAATWNNSIAGFVELLVPHGAASLLTYTLDIGLLLGVGWLSVRCRSIELPFALATVAALLVSGHTLAYDLTLLLIPASVALHDHRLGPPLLVPLLIVCDLTIFVGYRLVISYPFQLAVIGVAGLGVWLAVAAHDRHGAIRTVPAASLPRSTAQSQT